MPLHTSTSSMLALLTHLLWLLRGCSRCTLADSGASASGSSAQSASPQQAIRDGVTAAYWLSWVQNETEERRRYRLFMDGEANIKEWGAKGDGTTDDTGAIEAAMEAVITNPAGGVITVPAGTFVLTKRLKFETAKPLVLRGIAPDVSRLVWSGNTTEGLAITPSGMADPLANDALITVTELSLLCASEGDAKSSALLIEGTQQIAPLASGAELLGFRGVTRVRVTSVSIRGAWAYGLVLRSTHLAEVETLNIAGVGPGKGSTVAVLMDGAGAPTGHTFENLRVYFFGTGIRAESVLELSCVQNHINCAKTGIMATNADQCFFMANLIYHNRGEGNGIWIKGESKIATSNIVAGNTIVGVQGSSKLRGVTLDDGVSGAVVSNNIFLKQETALYRPESAEGLFSYVSYLGNIARGVETEVAVPGGPAVFIDTLE